MVQDRERFSGRFGFLLAAVGSAVGLGNMWRFSYLAAENGGASFVLLYLFFTLVIGLPVLLAEMTLGRGAGRGPIGALVHYGGPRWRVFGFVFVIAAALILSYYSVIAGWTLRYTAIGIGSGFSGDAGARFETVSSGGAALAWHLGFMGVTIALVAGGVKKGIERTALLLMPLLFLIVVGLAIYAATLEGASAGYRAYLAPNLGDLLHLPVIVDAAGQAFFSLSLGMGAMLTFASYLERDHDLPREALVIALSDFGVAFLAGLVVFPVIYALGLQGEVGESTVGALFITLPQAFDAMGGAGRWVGSLFFAALVFGALTSALSLLEVAVASAIDVGWSRRRATWVIGGAIATLGVLPALSIDWLGRMDTIAGNVLLVGGGLVLALFTSFVVADPETEMLVGAPRAARFVPAWRFALRFAVPPLLFFVLLHALGLPALLAALF